jgi:hypothetical protein
MVYSDIIRDMQEKNVGRWMLSSSALLGGLAGAGAVLLFKARKPAIVVTEKEQADDSEQAVTPDDLDKEQLEQLHAATLKASDSCFEIKKLCATVLIPTGTLVSVFTNKRLNAAVFVSGLLVVVAFWLADAVGYFYQRKLRNVMAPIWGRRAARFSEKYEHIPGVVKIGPMRAAFNSSMVYYLILAALIGLGFLLYGMGVIVGSEPGTSQ